MIYPKVSGPLDKHAIIRYKRICAYNVNPVYDLDNVR